MKAVRVHGPGDVRVDDIATPTAGPNDIIVRPAVVGICGSDLIYTAHGGVSSLAQEPFGLGHELAGVIDSVGSDVRDLKPGARVVINPMGDGNAIGNGSVEGAFAPKLLVRNATADRSVLSLPDSVSFEDGALVEPLAVGMHACNRAALKPGDKIAVFGAGPIGLGIIAVLRRRGFDDIAIIDMSDFRLELARALGAKHLINPKSGDVAKALADVHGGGDVFGLPVVNTNVFFEVTAAAPVVGQIIEMAPFHAHLVVVAVHHHPVSINLLTALSRELVITMSMAYVDEFQTVIDDLASGKLKPQAMVTHSFGLDEFLKAFSTASDKDAAGKVLIAIDGRSPQ